MVRIAFEVREEGRELHGVILQEGRASSGGRAEVFAPVRSPGLRSGIADSHGIAPNLEIRAVPPPRYLGPNQHPGPGN